MPLLLFAFWLILNGKITIEIILVGAVITAALTRFTRKLLHITPQAETQILRRLPGVILYVFYLVWQIILANLQVMRVILSGRKLESKIVWFKPIMKTELARLALVNSITLTPGTITMEITEEDEQTWYYVHWIEAETDGAEAGETIKGRMEKWIRRFWE